MPFTDDEKRMIRWLRGQHAHWKTTRAITLTCSLIIGAIAVWRVWLADPIWYLLPLFAISGYGLSYTLGSWSGRPEISLLLRLVEAEERRNGQSEV